MDSLKTMTRVYLCHEESQKNYAARVKKLLHLPDIRCFDGSTDILGNEQELSVIDEQMTQSKWIVVILSSDSTKSELFSYTKGMAVDNALSICLKNIIVLCSVDVVKLIPDELRMFPSIILENTGWEKELLHIIVNTKPASIMMENSCRNKHHVNLANELNKAGFPNVSEPDCKLSGDDSGQSVIPHSQAHKVTARAKWRTLPDLKHTPVPQAVMTYPKIQRLVRQAQRRNSFYKYHATYFGNHKLCACYFYTVCTVPNIIICVAWLLSLIRILGSKERNLFLDNVEVVLSYCALILVNAGTLVLFRNCSQVLSCMKSIKCYKSLCWSQLFGLLTIGWAHYSEWCQMDKYREYFKVEPHLSTHADYIIKAFESMAILTLIIAFDENQSQNTWVERLSYITRNIVYLILVLEMFFIKMLAMGFEWILFTTSINVPSLSSIYTRLILISIVFHFRQIYTIILFKFGKVKSNTLPSCMAKCQKSHRSRINILTLLCFTLIPCYIYIIISRVERNSTSAVTNINESPQNRNSILRTVLRFLLSFENRR